MTEQMLQLQSRQEAEQKQMQNVADSIDDSTTTSSVEQLLEVVRYHTQLVQWCSFVRLCDLTMKCRAVVFARDWVLDILCSSVRYLRKEKELVEARYELLQSETTRLRQQNANIKRQADMAEKTLAEERENSQVFLFCLVKDFWTDLRKPEAQSTVDR